MYAINSFEDAVLISPQLAAYHGQARLCDYLLGNVEHFKRDDQLHQAVTWLDYAPYSTSLQAEILELFAGKYDMDVYILGPHDDCSRALRSVFYELSKVIMSHQPLSLERASLADRFNIAMKLRGRSPVDFLTTVGLGIDDQLLTMTDETGSTVLHWAAMHWSICHRREWSSSRLESYGNLILDLIRAGSSVSAINERGHSPLMYLLKFDHPSHEWLYATYSIPDRTHPSQIVSSWGVLLSQAGVSLSEYVERENFLLSCLETEHPIHFLWRNRWLELKGIALGDQTTFIMEVGTTQWHSIWECQPTPGSFMDPTPDLYRLPWCPSSEDDSRVFWQCIETKLLRSSKPFHLSPDSIDDIEFDLGQVLFGGTQDDHRNLAAVYRREQQRLGRARNDICGKRRSSSTPPASKKFHKEATRIPGPHSPKGYAWSVHKCPQDVRWGFCTVEYGDSRDLRAICMAGCSGRPDHGSHIAATFLPPEKALMTPRERWLAENFPWKYGKEANLTFGWDR